MSLVLLAIMVIISVCFGRDGTYGGEQSYDCGMFKKYPARCVHRRKNYCEKGSASYNYDKCDKVRYCCPKDLDAGTCSVEFDELRAKCDITGDGCRAVSGDATRRLLGESYDCMCAWTVEDHLFCAKDVGGDKCKTLQKCEYTSDCTEYGAGCIKCDTCGDYKEGVCFPGCNRKTTATPTVYTTPTPTIYTTTAEPTTDSPTPYPTTDSPTPYPTTDSPTPYPTTAEPTSTTPYPTTDSPTPYPTTDTPTPYPTTDTPTPYPTTDTPTPYPTTDYPTPYPTTDYPTPYPTTDSPTTDSPTPYPTTDSPTPYPTTDSPTPYPTTAEPTSTTPYPTSTTPYPTSTTPKPTKIRYYKPGF